MPIVNMAMPILSGKEAAAREFAAAVSGPKADAFTKWQNDSATTRETWHLQETPEGSMMLVWFEVDDIEKSFVHLATANDDFTLWMRDRIKEITGQDMQEADGAPPEQIVDWSA